MYKLEELKAMDKKLKDFLSQKIFEEGTAVYNEIYDSAWNEGFEQREVAHALEVFLYCKLIDPGMNGQVSFAFPSAIYRDFMVSEPLYRQLKVEGYF